MNGSAPSAGGPPSHPGGGAPVLKRKKPLSDPFFKGPRRNPAARPQLNGHATPAANGHLPLKAPALQASTPNSQRASSPAKPAIPDNERVSGFSDPRVTAEGIPYKDYKLVTTKRDLLHGLRYHILQLAGDKVVDIRNEAEFSKPARLHRRDPRAPPPGQHQHKEEEGDFPDLKDGLNAAEREELGRRKEIRQREREANLAQIAPSQNAARKMNAFKKKTQQVFRPDLSAEDKRRIQTNYEEKLPWHLEDFDNKHCLIGHHQIGSMSSNAALVFEPAVDASTGKFRLIPIEKAYQFKPKRELAQQMTIEEVEAAMKKRGSDPEWLIRQREARVAEASKELVAKRAKGIFTGAQTQNVAGRTGEDADLDFEDDFADDEEGDLFVDKDEDEKIAEKRIKEDQLQANFLDFKDLKEYDEAEEREKKEAEARKRNFRELRKALEKRERNYNHGSDSEYESSTEDEEERERIERERQENLKKDEEEKKSALPSSGNNTPSGRKEKKAGTGSDRERLASRSLKRPGSPNLSEGSGTDASARRKKLKSKHMSSTQPTPGPSRPMSPANVLPSSSAPGLLDPKIRKRTGGAGSDTDAGMSDRDGAAMSDGSRTARRLKLKMSASPPGTNPPSRAASPAPGASRGAPSPGASNPIAFPSVQDIKNAVPTQGIAIKDLMKIVAHPRERRAEFVNLVKEVARMDKERGVLVLK
ncbi:transcription initiation factor TFIIF alpha subunit [Exophiala viscosa]|uniref:transcription initiation factor TFIIF alpha subunit n=1 Tax=Exophiala viscosa TaxID=2486360 RepID=UPI00219F1057|nr:transcription initiation factor TFIIF alpha subunit [Exophiala viscosa]